MVFPHDRLVKAPPGHSQGLASCGTPRKVPPAVRKKRIRVLLRLGLQSLHRDAARSAVSRDNRVELPGRPEEVPHGDGQLPGQDGVFRRVHPGQDFQGRLECAQPGERVACRGR